MYCEFYGFREKPFNITPNPRFIFLSKNHREAFAHLLYGIDNHSGFIELTGEVGTGKTTVLRTLLEQLDERGHRTALIFNPCLSALELMKSINREFGIGWEGLSSAELLDALNQFLLSENASGRTVVLVIDEAQNLEPQVLEQVRLISNLETKTDKLIQIVLAGQPELKALLNRPELRQIAQRITVSYHLPPLDFDDTTAYIEHRLEVAGDWRAATFHPRALKRVYQHTGGVPRLINILCDRALLFGYIGESREINLAMVNAAIAEIRRETGGGGFFRSRWTGAVLAVLVTVVVVVVAVGRYGTGTGTAAFTSGISVPTAPPEVIAARFGVPAGGHAPLPAFNALLKQWHAVPLDGKGPLQFPRDYEQQAAQRGMKLTRYRGSLGLLMRLGYPAILEVSFPGSATRDYLPLIAVEKERLVFALPTAGTVALSGPELESIWSGNAYILWKDVYSLTGSAIPGARGPQVSRLQQLLKKAESYSGPDTGYFGAKTAAALKVFQDSHRLDADAAAGPQTLLLLYRKEQGEKIPVLDRQGAQFPQ